MKKAFKIIIFLTCAFFALFSCSVKNDAALTQETSKDSIANYLEQKPSEDSSETNEQNVKPNKQDNQNTVLSVEDNDTDIEYDVYKKVDFSSFIKNEKDSAFIDHIDDGIYLSDAPCKVTIKATVKIEKGSGLPEEDINDAFATTLALGPLYCDIYYADYDDNYFGKFHEIEVSEEYFNGRSGKGKIWFSNFGISGCKGSIGYKDKYVLHNSTEYIGEVLTQDKSQTKLRVTIKDIYYKINKPTGTVTEWDLDKDFELSNFYGTQCFAMRELEDGYTYIIKPKFMYIVNDEYDDRKAKHLGFYYTSNSKTPENATRIMNEQENVVTARYNKIGIGVAGTDWRKKGESKYVDFDLVWNKTDHTISVNEKRGNNIAMIKIDYIKEYKYKNCPENETPGYKRYLLATEQNDTNNNVVKAKLKEQVKLGEIEKDFIYKKYGEIEERRILATGNVEKKTAEFGDYKVVYTTQDYNCKLIPNLEEIMRRAISESINKFFSEYYQFVNNNIPDFYQNVKCPNFTTYNTYETLNNYMTILYQDKPYKPSVILNITIDLINLKYKFYGSWEYGQDTTVESNTPKHGNVSIDFTSLGYEPIITDWYYKPIENIVSIEEAQVGDYIHFGKYWTQYTKDSRITYKKKRERENLEWKVLDIVDNKMLITTRHAIDCMYINIYNKDNTWENSNIRAWLNNEFIDYAFDNDEKLRIINEYDMAFLLSYEDVNKYFSSDYDRRCKATYFARSNNCWFSIKNGMCGNCNYWLKTLSYNQNESGTLQMCVNSYGEINIIGESNYSSNDLGIRPAMWVKIN